MFLAMEWAARRLKPCLIFTASRLSIWPTTTSKKYRRYGCTALCCCCYSHITSSLGSTSCQPSLIHAVTHVPSQAKPFRCTFTFRCGNDARNSAKIEPRYSQCIMCCSAQFNVLPHRPVQPHLPAAVHACYSRKSSFMLHHHLCLSSSFHVSSSKRSAAKSSLHFSSSKQVRLKPPLLYVSSPEYWYTTSFATHCCAL